MPPIEVYEVKEGVTIPATGVEPSSAGTQSDAVTTNGTGTPGAAVTPPAGETQPSSGSPPETPAAGEGESPADPDDTPLSDDEPVTGRTLNRRIARLTAQRHAAERELAAQHALAQQREAQMQGQLEVLTKLLQGAAPAPPLPETPAQPAGPPQAEQFASHEEYVLAAARYGAQQELQARDQQTQAERQRAQQAAFQQQLVERETAFKQAHPDFDERVRSGLAGKVSPVVQQALMLLPEGPAVAYALATQPEVVQRLNTLPPPLVFAELGRLSPPPPPTPPANGTPTPAPTGSAPSSPAQLPVPLQPLSGSSAGTPTGQWREGMSQEEFRRWRARTSELPEWKNRA